MATEWLYGDGTPMIGQPLQFASPPSSQYSQYLQNQTQTFSTRSPTKMAMAPQEFVDVRHTVMQPRTIVEPEHFESNQTRQTGLSRPDPVSRCLIALTSQCAN